MANNNDIDNPLYKATYGIIFFGTPHGGGNNVKAGQLAASIARFLWHKPKNSMLEALQGSSFFAEQNKDDFIQRAKDFAFVSFYETLPFKGTMVSRTNLPSATCSSAYDRLSLERMLFLISRMKKRRRFRLMLITAGFASSMTLTAKRSGLSGRA